RSYFDRLIALSDQSGMNFSNFFAQTSLFQDIDVIPDHVEKIPLMSMHAAKGLEFPVVFIAGCEDTIIPFSEFDRQDEDHINEERRLFYVALTRAQNLLYCTYSNTRRLFGKKHLQTISRFLQDVENKLKIKDTSLTKKFSKKNVAIYTQPCLL
ncbi:MAG: ATP-binding domain-containing protein, partial [Candidatus Magnetomorum sp.]|nr:ATP-binding domain-containing protein [Candidatus Magnetomorum sp.]